MQSDFWKGRRVFVTGHTGFKGAWLALWLERLGANVTGYSLEPPTDPSLFELANISQGITHHIGDIRDAVQITHALNESSAEIILHLAAQPLVRKSYKEPAETFSTNVMGTLNVLEAARASKTVRAIVNVTTDKCYENREWHWGYREVDALGGYDPYSSSKACSELLTAAYRTSYFHPDDYSNHGIALATARAGNVIGGGDWAGDRLVPDCIRAALAGQSVEIRSPAALRPWQHVLEPLAGYLTLAERLYVDGPPFMKAWNFGPDDGDVQPVERVVGPLLEKLGLADKLVVPQTGEHPHEAGLLKLDCSMAKAELGWYPVWNLDTAMDRIAEWVQIYRDKPDQIRQVCLEQIEAYSTASASRRSNVRKIQS